jgi:hypothetical protein
MARACTGRFPEPGRTYNYLQRDSFGCCGDCMLYADSVHYLRSWIGSEIAIDDASIDAWHDDRGGDDSDIELVAVGDVYAAYKSAVAETDHHHIISKRMFKIQMRSVIGQDRLCNVKLKGDRTRYYVGLSIRDREDEEEEEDSASEWVFPLEPHSEPSPQPVPSDDDDDDDFDFDATQRWDDYWLAVRAAAELLGQWADGTCDEDDTPPYGIMPQ